MDPSGVAEDGGEADTVPGKWAEEEGGGGGEEQGCVGCVRSLHEVGE